MFTFLRNLFIKKSAPAMKVVGLKPYNYARKYENAYSIPIIRSAIDYIAKSCSGIPIHFYDSKGNIVDFYPRPNEYQGWTSFVEDSVRKKYLFGFNIIQKSQTHHHNLNITQLKDRAITNAYGAIRYFQDPYDNKKYLPILESASIIVDRHNEALKASMNLLMNSGSPGILSVNPQDSTYATAKMIQEAEREYRENYTGGKNYGKIAFVGVPVNFMKTLMSFNETGILDIYKFDIQDVSRLFGIPSILLGDNEQSTYNNVQEAVRRFYRDVVIPEIDDLCEALTLLNQEAFELRGYHNGYVSYDINDVTALHEERATLVKTWLELLDKQIIDKEQIKKLLQR